MRDAGRRWNRRASGLATLLAGGLVAACVGGGGPGGGELDGWEPAPSTREGAGTSDERPPASGDSAPGAGGARPAFTCDGRYVCSDGQGTTTIKLETTRAGCGTEEVVLAPDGTILVKGRPVGSWSATPSGFTATTPDGHLTCRRSSGGRGAAGDDQAGEVDDDDDVAMPAPDRD